jgi:ankyrin repeat protein
MWPPGKQRRANPIGPCSWGAPLALFALVSISAAAADRCSVSEFAVGVPDGRAAWVVGGIGSMPPPVVQITTVHRSVVAATAVTAPTPAPAPAPGSTTRNPPRRPPRAEPHNDQERLFAAVFDGDLERVRRLLDSPSVDVNAPARSDLRRSLIDVAAMVAQPQIARALIEHGASVRGPLPAVDLHPIAIAMLNLKTTIQFHGDPVAFSLSPERAPADFEATIRVLLDAGADADGVLDPTHPESALGVLLTTPRFDGDLRIARLLLEHGAQLGVAAPGGAPLAIAVAQGRDDFVDLALSAGRIARSALDTALTRAVERQNAGMVAKLLDAGASPDSRDESGRPLLCWQVFAAGSPRSVATLLLQHGARLDIDCLGGPPLNLAMNDRELALLMIDHGADPSRADRNGATALDLVADADHDLVDALVRHGARLGQPSGDAAYFRDLMRVAAPGPTVRAILRHQDYVASRLLQRDGLVGDGSCAAVIYAAATGATGTLAELLRRGADPNSMTEGGISALMAAAYHGEVEALSLLLAQRRIDVNRATPLKINLGQFSFYSEDSAPTRTGKRTALMYAAAAGRAAGVAMLLQHGASDRQTDAEGLAALDYAHNAEARNALQAAHR